MKNKKSTTPESVANKKIKNTERFPIGVIFLKLGILIFLLFCGLAYSDSKGFFNPDNKNNHTKKKWDAFYDFSVKNPVDVLLIGNSHLYTGINPKNLSSSLGCNAFILASPGTTVIDQYYSLKEAIQINKPKLVVIETYGLKKIKPYSMEGGALTDQFKSFNARKHLSTKLTSTVDLFAPKNYFYAWSNTIRNHDFLYKDFKQIEKNIDISKKKVKKKKKLYLGRYVRFKTGLEKNVLQKYQNEGAPVDGDNYEVNDVLGEYVQKTIDLCKENNIELMFLTLPMYKEHVDNYGLWRSDLASVLGDYSSDNNWLDLQVKENYEGFTEGSFENTYKSNQHMTYGGSLIATYKLVDFINENKKEVLPIRSQDKSWRKLFYGEEGFFENNTPGTKDKKNISLYEGDENTIVEEILLLKSDKYYSLLAKIHPENADQFDQLVQRKFAVSLSVKNKNGAIENVWVNLQVDVYHSCKERICFLNRLKPLDVVKVNEIKLI